MLPAELSDALAVFPSLSLSARADFLRELFPILRPSELGLALDLHAQNTKGVDFVSLVPIETAVHIASYLHWTDVLRLKLVSKAWKRLADNTAVWHRIVVDLYQSHQLLDYENDGKDPKAKALWLLKGIRSWQKPTTPITFQAHGSDVMHVRVKGNILVTGSRDRLVKAWDIRTLTCIGTMEMGNLLHLEFVETRQELIVVGCDFDSRIHIRSFFSPDSYHILIEHPSANSGLCVDEEFVYSGGLHEFAPPIYVWDMKTGKLKTRLDTTTHSVRCHSEETPLMINISPNLPAAQHLFLTNYAQVSNCHLSKRPV
ncbi:WD40-repeat-containing domain protein [Fimicolochytrium jonesii]|uniref:WD40-repeat-containing domain protein n=1 Tax=Fimicolochytrium jonesii TaxID=1396493 RepID=UPI0022FDE408|nr:WD40-repeat-containing domain protein [Fimicolochytrium jonesii]KAI8817398.1 WD40-repeat-containing domain protein [Fimicolochytrium jonesii]